MQAYLKAGNAVAGALFGMSVDVHGDVIVVGAPGEASGSDSIVHGATGYDTGSGQTDAGAAYTFSSESSAGASRGPKK